MNEDELIISFQIKILNIMAIEGEVPQHFKGHRRQAHSFHFTQWLNVENFSCTIRNRTGYLPLTSPFSRVLEVLARAIGPETENESIYVRKEVKMCLQVQTLFIENPKNSTKKLFIQRPE